MAKRRFWLLKSEPEVFAFEDLLAAPERTTFWDGVRNYQARNMLRDDLSIGDGVLYYHSNADPAGIVGVACVASVARIDPTQLDPEDPHFDPRAKADDPPWYGVDIRAVASLPVVVTLPMLKADPRLTGMAVVQRGQRLSVQPVTPEEWQVVLGLGGLSAAAARSILAKAT